MRLADLSLSAIPTLARIHPFRQSRLDGNAEMQADMIRATLWGSGGWDDLWEVQMQNAQAEARLFALCLT